ncbi:uncharacterized protein LOC132745651 [Ruditapes philippinarum]|uniref:uncharacterized protein LOC132745651 n=1 Tax=Ruditapes philippinarum TaxID=129788 RepID=UPI00295B4A98|nr:uncharacterized protein LOC132745651 [Ruditapes philippinarum]
MSHGLRFLLVLFGLFSVRVCGGLIEEFEEESDLLIDEEEPLRCYFCHAMGPTNECELYQPYIDAREAADDGRQHDGPVTLKTCSPPFDVSCMIETFINNIGEVAHIRDCSDDKTFDFNEISNNKSSYARLIGLRDNNETACVYDGQNTVCLSKCGHSENMTDFCNGPQYGSTSTAVFSKILFMTILFCYVLFNP